VPRAAVAAVERLFVSARGRDFLGEAVTMAEHQLQAAAIARRHGAPDALVVAALLHDVGHLIPSDGDHGEAGSRWLGQWFGVDVTEPVRLHVAAKRYLVATETGYAEGLSTASIDSLRAQGGPMDDDEALAFRGGAHAPDAIALRRFDDAAKDPAVSAAGLDTYRPLLEALSR
jgi:gamma-butyrobetaine dioxygenase